MGEIIPLITERDIVHQSVIETLEAALIEAREGEIIGIALGVVRPDLSINTSWSQTDGIGPLLGASSLLHHRLLMALEDDEV